MQILLVKSLENGIEKAKEILYEEVDNKTVLFLSGGSTPKPLYENLADEKFIRPGAVGLVDERFGAKFHENSNELMIKQTGLLDYLENRQIPFYPIINARNNREEEAKMYDTQVRNLFFHFPQSVAILGIGTDGHISSIIPNRKDFTNPMFDPSQKDMYVGDFDDKNKYGERIGITFSGLQLMDSLIIFVFGKDKRKPLKQIMMPGSMEEIPARFLLEPEVSRKSVLITDQKI